KRAGETEFAENVFRLNQAVGLPEPKVHALGKNECKPHSILTPTSRSCFQGHLVIGIVIFEIRIDEANGIDFAFRPALACHQVPACRTDIAHNVEARRRAGPVNGLEALHGAPFGTGVVGFFLRKSLFEPTSQRLHAASMLRSYWAASSLRGLPCLT